MGEAHTERQEEEYELNKRADEKATEAKDEKEKRKERKKHFGEEEKRTLGKTKRTLWSYEEKGRRRRFRSKDKSETSFE